MTADRVEVVMDTNVPMVANGEAEQASLECERACTDTLDQIREGRRILLDDRDLIFNEYEKNLSYAGEPGPGDAFFVWLYNSEWTPEYCRRVPVTPHSERGLEEFPGDPELGDFDPDDRKFVAVAIASGTIPEILNASDTDWWYHSEVLRRNGVRVTFLCPELMVNGV